MTHIGHGDAIVQTGLARELVKMHGPIAFPSYEQYETSTKSFFVNDPDISVYTLPHQEDWDWGSPPEWAWAEAIKKSGMDQNTAIRAGVFAGIGIDWDFTQSFYKHVNVPYNARWDSCPLPEAKEKTEQIPAVFPGNRKIFLHDDPFRGFLINRLVNRQECFLPSFDTWNQSILRYIDLIMAAEEIHVIDSAFFHLVNCFNPSAKLFLHCYCRWPRPVSFRYLSRLSWRYIF
jgi:hypothetical protein